MMQKKSFLLWGAVLIAGLVLGYLIGSQTGYKSGYSAGDDSGYKRAEADIKKLEGDSAKKAAEDAARAANPFQVSNPLEGVETNPFQKAKKVLNPFE